MSSLNVFQGSHMHRCSLFFFAKPILTQNLKKLGGEGNKCRSYDETLLTITQDIFLPHRLYRPTFLDVSGRFRACKGCQGELATFKCKNRGSNSGCIWWHTGYVFASRIWWLVGQAFQNPRFDQGHWPGFDKQEIQYYLVFHTYTRTTCTEKILFSCRR